MILAKRKNDLYENISDDFLSLRSNSMRAKAERLAKCKSVPSFINSFNLTSASVSEANLLRPDQGYGNRYNLIDCIVKKYFFVFWKKVPDQIATPDSSSSSCKGLVNW